jgi:hypothetical protein
VLEHELFERLETRIRGEEAVASGATDGDAHRTSVDLDQNDRDIVRLHGRG